MARQHQSLYFIAFCILIMVKKEPQTTKLTNRKKKIMAYKNNERVSLLKLFLQKFIVSKGQRCMGSLQLLAAFLFVAVFEFKNFASVTYCRIKNALPVIMPVAPKTPSYPFTDSSTCVAIFVLFTQVLKTYLFAYGLVNGLATLICSIVFASSH